MKRPGKSDAEKSPILYKFCNVTVDRFKSICKTQRTEKSQKQNGEVHIMSDAMMVLLFFVGGYGMRMLMDLLRYGEF